MSFKTLHRPMSSIRLGWAASTFQSSNKDLSGGPVTRRGFHQRGISGGLRGLGGRWRSHRGNAEPNQQPNSCLDFPRLFTCTRSGQSPQRPPSLPTGEWIRLCRLFRLFRRDPIAGIEAVELRQLLGRDDIVPVALAGHEVELAPDGAAHPPRRDLALIVLAVPVHEPTRDVLHRERTF